jgi:hypothetical protein
MNFIKRARPAGTILATFALTVSATLTGSLANADTIFTVNGVAVDSAVVDLYFENRLGRPGPPESTEEREVLMSELKDIYLLSTQDFVAELAKEPRAAAQLELQKRGILAQVAAADFFASSTATEEELLAEYAVQIELAPPLQFNWRRKNQPDRPDRMAVTWAGSHLTRWLHLSLTRWRHSKMVLTLPHPYRRTLAGTLSYGKHQGRLRRQHLKVSATILSRSYNRESFRNTWKRFVLAVLSNSKKYSQLIDTYNSIYFTSLNSMEHCRS